MRLADLPRSSNRALIDLLFNGAPPYSAQEIARDKITTAVNFLDSTRIAHDMRRQYSNAFLKPGNFFKVKLDYGPPHKRMEWGSTITNKLNHQMKRGKSAQQYRECLRNIFAQTTLHGIGPASWADKEKWCPTMHQMCDVMVPSGTLLTMENLGHFAIYRRYTYAELWRMTHGPKVDKAWNMEVVKKCLEWALREGGQTVSSTDSMSPERIAEAVKADLGYYSIDTLPTINCWDFYYLCDEDDDFSWRRKIVLDTPSATEAGATAKGSRNFLGEKDQFLYNPDESRKYASSLSEIISFQFADGSVVAPFRYHSVRSLGFLLYAVCHLQNRLRCKFNDSVFESLLNYFRASNPLDFERLQKVDLVNLGVIPEGLQFIPRNERWNVDAGLVQMGMALNKQSMTDNSTSFTQDFGANQDGPEKTATEISAQVNASTALVGSMLQEAYGYQEFQYQEICRRFCIPNSKDPDVKAFRAACLRDGVPEEALKSECWEVDAERVIGAGNKQLEMAQVDGLMAVIDRLDPDAQRIVMGLYVQSRTDDSALTSLIVPLEKNMVTDSVHDAQVSLGTLLMALPMGLKQGVNHQEYAGALLEGINAKIAEITQMGGMTDQDAIVGLQNALGMTIEGEPIPGNGAQNHVAILENQPQSKEIVKELGDAIAKALNEVRAFQQRLTESQQQQGAEGQPQVDPVAIGKVKAMLLQAETKAEIDKQKAQQKLDWKSQGHAQQLTIKQQNAAQQQADTAARVEAEIAATDARTAGDIRRQAAEPNQVPVQ